MKKFIMAALAASMLMLSGCGNNRIINGTDYQTYGLANSGRADPKIEYEISAGSVIWAILLSETIVFPVYILGWDLYQPVKAK